MADAATAAPGTGLSVVIPVYNERDHVEALLRKVRAALPACEMVVVDDCSTDGTRELLQQLADGGEIGFTLLRHERNGGKGAAMRTGFAAVTGEFVVVQDADHEYDPQDLPPMLTALRAADAAACYGSRFKAGGRSRLGFAHVLLNRGLTWAGNLVTGLGLTDMETCYKMLRTNWLQRLELRENRFGFDPEITVAIAAAGGRVIEVPISYAARTYAEGKKIGLRDLVRCQWVLFRDGWRKLPGRMLVTTLGTAAVAAAVIGGTWWLCAR